MAMPETREQRLQAIKRHPAGKYILPEGLSLVSTPQPEDVVNHPTHYTSDPSGIECIQITRHRNFNIGNAIKYLWRAGLKGGDTNVQDLKKAVWYIQDEINRLEGDSK